MANISAIKLPNGNTYDLVDKTSGFVTTDNKLEISSVSNGSYYPIVASNSTTAAIRQYDNTGFEYLVSKGTTSAVGSAKLTLGNSTASGTANNKQGQLVLYGSTAYAHTIQGAPTAARTLTLPNKTGTIALTSDIPANEIFVAVYDVTSYNDILSAYNAGKTIVAKYPDEDFTTDADFYYLTEANVTYTGEFTFVNSSGQYVVTIMVNDSDEWSESGFFIPSITLNGSGAQSASFYAPTSAGTSGYVLTSNGSGAPSWSKSTATPTASTISKFDSSAKMNSTDMTSAEVDTFVDGLNPQGNTVINITPSSISTFITASSGFTISTLEVYQYGQIIQGFFRVARNTSWSANSVLNIGTIASQYRPICSTSIGTDSVNGVITATDGAVYIRPLVAISANSTCPIPFMWIKA